MPRRASAASTATVTVVLPAPDCGAAMMTPRAVMAISPARRRTSGTAASSMVPECPEKIPSQVRIRRSGSTEKLRVHLHDIADDDDGRRLESLRARRLRHLLEG